MNFLTRGSFNSATIPMALLWAVLMFTQTNLTLGWVLVSTVLYISVHRDCSDIALFKSKLGVRVCGVLAVATTLFSMVVLSVVLNDIYIAVGVALAVLGKYWLTYSDAWEVGFGLMAVGVLTATLEMTNVSFIAGVWLCYLTLGALLQTKHLRNYTVEVRFE